jgi:hypothetical protein
LLADVRGLFAEIGATEVRDVDLKAGVINMRRALSENAPVAPKSGHERVVPFSRVWQRLWPTAGGKLPAARVVVNQSGRTPSRQAVWTDRHATSADLRDAIGRLPGN